MSFKHLLRNSGLAGIVAVASMGVATSGVAAYGRQDQPLAQIEFSDNCNNLADCGFPNGLGGGWVWIEIDQGGTGDVAGSVCGHDRQGHGGAVSIRGDITWEAYNGSNPGGQAEIVGGIDPNDHYYIVTVDDPVIGHVDLAFPRTFGHYKWHPDPGVARELQVAP